MRAVRGDRVEQQVKVDLVSGADMGATAGFSGSKAITGVFDSRLPSGKSGPESNRRGCGSGAPMLSGHSGKRRGWPDRGWPGRGWPGRIRTGDLPLRRRLLCPAELRAIGGRSPDSNWRVPLCRRVLSLSGKRPSVPSARLERAAPTFGGWCAIQLRHEGKSAPGWSRTTDAEAAALQAAALPLCHRRWVPCGIRTRRCLATRGHNPFPQPLGSRHQSIRQDSNLRDAVCGTAALPLSY